MPKVPQTVLFTMILWRAVHATKVLQKNTVWESDAQSWEPDSQTIFFASIPDWEASQTVFLEVFLRGRVPSMYF